MSITFLCVNVNRQGNSTEIEVLDFCHFPGSTFIVLSFKYICVLVNLDSKATLSQGIKYKFSQRFSIDLNVPLKIYDLRVEKNKIKNPAIPIRQQTTNDYNHIYLESAYSIRLGLMYKLNK